MNLNEIENIFDKIGLKIGDNLENKLIPYKVEERYTDFGLFFKDKLGIFDYAIFRFFGGRKDFSGHTIFNIILGSVSDELSFEKTRNLVNILFDEYGYDLYDTGKLSDSELEDFNSCWSGRMWILDLSGNKLKIPESDSYHIMVNLDYHNTRINMSILAANNLFKQLSLIR